MKTKQVIDFRKLEREYCGHRVAKVVLERIKFDVGVDVEPSPLDSGPRIRGDLQALSPKSKPKDSLSSSSSLTSSQQQKPLSFRNTARLKRKNNCRNNTSSDVDVTNTDDEGDTQPPSTRASTRLRKQKPKIYVEYNIDNRGNDSHDSDSDSDLSEPVSKQVPSNKNSKNVIQNQSKFQCDQCSKKTTTKMNLIIHKQFKHEIFDDKNPGQNKSKYQCDQCPKKTLTEFGLSKHKLYMHGKVPDGTYKCGLCPEITSSLRNLEQHKKYKHGIGQKTTSQTYNCDLCTGTFATSGYLERHIVTVHVADKPFECDICFKSLIDEPTLKKHINRHMVRAELAAEKANLNSGTTNKNKKYKCIYCLEEFFKTKIEFKQHMQLNHTDNQGPHGPCPLCNLIFPSESDFHDHLQLPRNESELKCSVCSELLDTQCLLNQHLRKKHKIDLKIQTQVQSKTTSTVTQTPPKANKPGSTSVDPKGFSCLVCSSVFPRRSDLNFHEITEKHRRWKCPVCSQMFAENESLKNHIRSRHSNARPMKCDQCDKTYKTRKDLKVHKLKHGSSKYACKICENKSYVAAKYLRVHMANYHGGERRYQCHLCDKAWASSADLKQHLLSHTEERPYLCQFCNRGYKSAKEAKRHMKSFCQIKKKMNLTTKTSNKSDNADNNECDDSGNGNACFSTEIKHEGIPIGNEGAPNEGFQVPRFELVCKKEYNEADE